MMVMLAILAITATASIQLGSVLLRRAAEDELLAVGTEFRNAIISYSNHTPSGQKRSPSSLQDLLKDPRHPHTVRHLRKIYTDPLTGKEDWGLLHTLDGNGITGVFSLAEGRPVKVANFDLSYQHFTGKTSYAEWRFAIGLPPGGSPANPRNPQPPGSSR